MDQEEAETANVGGGLGWVGASQTVGCLLPLVGCVFMLEGGGPAPFTH